MDNQSRITNALFEKPAKEFHIRLLARETGLNPNTIINITKRLEKEGLLEIRKDRERNLVIIKANTQNKLFKLRKKAHNLEKIYASGLVDYLENELAYPTIILFGSYAKAENHEKSDIDIFIISTEKKTLDLAKYERSLGAEIQMFIHTKKEFEKLKTTSPELLNNVINGTVLSGFIKAF